MIIDHQNIYFTSDFHIGHQNILRFDQRPFENLEQMHQTLIKNWNNVVEDEDTVFYLGDLSWGKPEYTKWFIHQLKGKIRYILGNHDRMRDIVNLGRFESIHEYGTEISIVDKDSNRGRQDIVLSHYPFYVWNKHHHGAFMLHGHSHGSLVKKNDPIYERKIMDVGCNMTNYTPISYGEVKKIMSKKEIKTVDHHES